MSGAELTIREMIEKQRELLAAHAEWAPPSPETARSAMLWMVEELGEAAAIIKKKGDRAIAAPGLVRGAFVEELCDMLMYFAKVCLCYGISPEEIAGAFREKHAAVMARDFAAKEASFLREAEEA